MHVRNKKQTYIFRETKQTSSSSTIHNSNMFSNYSISYKVGGSMDEVKMLFTDLELLKDSIEIASKEELKELIQSLPKIRDKIDEIEALALAKLKQLEVEELLEEEVEKEYEAEEVEIEEAIAVPKLSPEEMLTIAIAQKPEAPEYIKQEAQEIIKRYQLTDEDVERIYKLIFG